MKSITHKKRGFTLIEVMVASTIVIFILGGVLASFVFCQKLVKQSMSETEMAINGRLLRDKLLFRLNARDAKRSTGLINATNLSISGNTLTYKVGSQNYTLLIGKDGFTPSATLPKNYLTLPGDMTFVTTKFDSTSFDLLSLNSSLLRLSLGLKSNQHAQLQYLEVPLYGKIINQGQK